LYIKQARLIHVVLKQTGYSKLQKNKDKSIIFSISSRQNEIFTV